MGLEKALTLPNRENIGFYVMSGAYLLAGLVDCLLSIKGSDPGVTAESGPIAHFLLDYYTAFVALTANEVVESSAASNSHKNAICTILYTGAGLSGIGALGWMSFLYSFSK